MPDRPECFFEKNFDGGNINASGQGVAQLKIMNPDALTIGAQNFIRVLTQYPQAQIFQHRDDIG